jgi:hypothetical protein
VRKYIFFIFLPLILFNKITYQKQIFKSEVQFFLHEGLIEHNAKEFPKPVHFGGPRQFEQNLCNSD